MGERRDVAPSGALRPLNRAVGFALTRASEVPYPRGVTKARLTRHELSWLLTQEAQHAAERLRAGVQVLRTQGPQAAAAPVLDVTHDPAHHVDASLDALDDVMKTLSSLNQRASGGAAAMPRRGRIDLAALVVEVAPEARVSIEPGSGTEVYGDEVDLRRILQVLVGHGAGDGASVSVKRDGDDVRVSVVLGPDSSPTAETERAWIGRMTMRYGGRCELDGGNLAVSFPAEGAEERSEREALRRELALAKRQGEAYARELAAILDRGEEVSTASTFPPPAGAVAPVERFSVIAKVCAALSAELSSTLLPAARELTALRRPDVTAERLEVLSRQTERAAEVVATLASAAAVPVGELATEVDLGDVARSAARDCADLAARCGVAVNVRVSGGPSARVYVRAGPRTAATLTRELVANAIQASPAGSSVEIAVAADERGGKDARLVVDDAGPSLPASARRAYLALETHADAHAGRSGLPVFIAAELAAAVGARLELSDAPADASGRGVGLRATVSFPGG